MPLPPLSASSAAPGPRPPLGAASSSAPASPGIGQSLVSMTTAASTQLVPLLLRALYFGDGTKNPGHAIGSGKAYVPGRWVGYGEEIDGLYGTQMGGEYLKQLQDTKPLPMWWRYNGKTPPPWFQPNEPLPRGHLMRAPVPVPAPPFDSPFTPKWVKERRKPPRPAEFPYKHPMALPWANEGLMTCPCPGNPTMLCDCMSIEYPVELPVPRSGDYGEDIGQAAKSRAKVPRPRPQPAPAPPPPARAGPSGQRALSQMEDVLQQLLAPPMLEALTAMLVGTAASATGMNVLPKSVVDANFPFGIPFFALMFTVTWLLTNLLTATAAPIYDNAKMKALEKLSRNAAGGSGTAKKK